MIAPDLRVIKAFYFAAGGETFYSKSDLVAHFADGVVPEGLKLGQSCERGFNYGIGLGYWVIDTFEHSSGLPGPTGLPPLKGPFATHLEAAEALVAILREREADAGRQGEA